MGEPTLTDFLLARIAEDEAVARAVEPLPPVYDYMGDTPVSAAAELAVGEGADERTCALIARVAEPARVLAECEAKRRIVERHSACEDVSFGDASTCPDMRDLAAIYADHPDYRDKEWGI